MENKVLEYKILGVVSKTNKFRVYIPERNVSIEIPFRKDYYPPLVTMYTIIHKEEGSKYYDNNDIGYKVGDIIDLELPPIKLLMIEDGITYKRTTQTELDRYESIYHPESDNAKMYREMCKIME